MSGAGLTVEQLAVTAGLSKTTVYSWFGGLDGVYEALAQRHVARVLAGWDTSAPGDLPALRLQLLRIGSGLLDLLTDDVWVELQRIGTTRPEVAAIVRVRGLDEVQTLVEALFLVAGRHQLIDVPDGTAAAEAFAAFFGLVVADRQLRVLLGERRPTISTRRLEVARAVELFLRLHRP